jgi:translation elongation factor EF-G
MRRSAPLGETFDYATRLRGITRGRGHAVVHLGGYEIAPEATRRRVTESGSAGGQR